MEANQTVLRLDQRSFSFLVAEKSKPCEILEEYVMYTKKDDLVKKCLRMG